MKRLLLVLSVTAMCTWVGRGALNNEPLFAAEDPHAYFNALVARADHWKSYSLRSAAQLAYPQNGGYASSGSGGLWVTYSPTTDTDPAKQDAAKVVVPAFLETTTTSALADAMSSSQTTARLVVANGSVWGNNRSMKIDDEIMTVKRDSSIVNNTLTILRGQFGTAARAHSAGAPISASLNSVPNGVRLPLNTTDGHTYLLTWDAYWTSSYLRTGLLNHKTFQLSSGGDKIWFQVNTRFDGGSACCEVSGMFNALSDIAPIDARSLQNYGGNANWSLTDGNIMGPITTSSEPVQPKAGSFVIKPNTWVRYWLRLEQRANDYDYVDLWAADENRDAVQLYRRIPVSVRPATNGVDKFWLEFDTSSDDFLRGDLRNLVSYVRNFVALRDVPDVSSLFARPGATAKFPAPPQNVRIIR